jgi:HD-like signal output (HDOD) protein/CheY-like chemotaxis protein
VGYARLGVSHASPAIPGDQTECAIQNPWAVDEDCLGQHTIPIKQRAMTTRLRILFVDDEASILDGLRRLLRPLRDEWEIFTANGGLEALALLEREPLDVIVSDMRMPGIDGAQLLEAVRKQHPHMVRIVLSGQSDQETLLRSIGPVHQYLNKPCDLGLLKAAVSRSRALRLAINDPAVADLAAGVTSLPSLPELYVKILTCLRSPDPSLARLGEIVAHDIGMSARVLQLVNSALFSLPRTITSPNEAVALLGIDAVRMMTLAVEIVTHSVNAHAGGVAPEGLWQHSLVVAHLAKAIAQAERQAPDLCNAAFSAGLMHDCGKLVLAHHLPERYRVLMTEPQAHLHFEVAEREALGVSHANVGGYLLSLWGLPDALIEAVVFHHRPNECPATNFTPLTAVHIAEGFERCGAWSADTDAVESHLDHDYLARLGLTQRIPAWTAIALAVKAKVRA